MLKRSRVSRNMKLSNGVNFRVNIFGFKHKMMYYSSIKRVVSNSFYDISKHVKNENFITSTRHYELRAAFT